MTLLLQVLRSWNVGQARDRRKRVSPSRHLPGALPLDRPLLTRPSVKGGGASRTVSSRLAPRRLECREDRSSTCILTGRKITPVLSSSPIPWARELECAPSPIQASVSTLGQTGLWNLIETGVATRIRCQYPYQSLARSRCSVNGIRYFLWGKIVSVSTNRHEE